MCQAHCASPDWTTESLHTDMAWNRAVVDDSPNCAHPYPRPVPASSVAGPKSTGSSLFPMYVQLEAAYASSCHINLLLVPTEGGADSRFGPHSSHVPVLPAEETGFSQNHPVAVFSGPLLPSGRLCRIWFRPEESDGLSGYLVSVISCPRSQFAGSGKNKWMNWMNLPRANPLSATKQSVFHHLETL
jgi:hypothetical protein